MEDCAPTESHGHTSVENAWALSGSRPAGEGGVASG
jgi:hypothetical protein